MSMVAWQRRMERAAVEQPHDPAAPVWSGLVPRCAEDMCPHYDGKRCEVLGMRPRGICEPVVSAMGELIDACASAT